VETDFFYLKDVDWQVGHIGISDFGHTYWVLALILCESENEDSSLKLIEAMIQMIEDASGKPEFVLVDGGAALEAAINRMNISREQKDKAIVRLRRCFAHNGRMPGKRRENGLMGGKGSIPRGMLTRGVKYDVMAKVSHEDIVIGTFYHVPGHIHGCVGQMSNKNLSQHPSSCTTYLTSTSYPIGKRTSMQHICC